jgi:hypothetical protein
MPEPWNLCPALTSERLQIVAREVVRVRDQVLMEHRPGIGDNAWSQGCVCYVRTCFAFQELERSGDHPWITVTMNGLECTLSFDSVPVSFYRGEPDSPSGRALARGIRVAAAQTLLPGFEEHLAASAEEDGWFWLMAIVPKEDGSVLRIVILQACAEGDTRNAWEIPLDSTVATVGLVSSIVREPVDLPPPEIGPKADDSENAKPDKTGHGSAK